MTIHEAIPFGWWYRWLMLVGLICVLPWYSRLGNTPGRPNSWFFFLAVLYPVGKLLQLFELGAGPFRWYMADTGFVSFTAMAFGEFTRDNQGRARRLASYRTGTFAALLLSLGIEWMQTVASSAGQAGAARGDVVDATIFVATASFSMLLLDRASRSHVNRFSFGHLP